MASVLHPTLSFSPPFFLVLLATSFTYAHADLVNDVCSKTQHPRTCLQALRSDPRTKKADLPGLGYISIDLSTKQAKSTQTLIRSLLKTATDPKLKNRYLSCLENYDESVDSLGRCPEFLKKKDYGSLNVYASAALDGPVTCDDGFVEPPAEPPQLIDAGVKLQAVCSAILVICNKLKGA